jgi:hypothetical protein
MTRFDLESGRVLLYKLPPRNGPGLQDGVVMAKHSRSKIRWHRTHQMKKKLRLQRQAAARKAARK